MAFVFSTLRILGASILAFMFPRLLVGVGIPLDEIAVNIGAKVGIIMTTGAAITYLGVALALIMMFTEIWVRPVGRLMDSIKRRDSSHDVEQLSESVSTRQKDLQSPRITLVELCKLAADQGWKFTAEGSQHVFDFVRTFRDAGSTEAVQFWGREKQRIDSMTRNQPLVKISPDYWKKFKIDGISLLKISPRSGEAGGLETDNSRTVTVADGNLTQHSLYVDIHLDRESAVNWLANEGVKRRGEHILKDSNFEGLDSPFYLSGPTTSLSIAIFSMVQNSNWGYQKFGNQNLLIDQNELFNAMQEAAKLVWEATKLGELTVTGTEPGTSNRKPVPVDDWKYAVLDVQSDATLGWKVSACPIDGNSERDNRAWRYEDLEVDSLEFEGLWPGDV